MGKFLVSVLVATAAAMVAAQPQSHYRGGGSSYPSYRGFARDITDYGIYKLMSAIQGGGRGHRELLGAGSGIRNTLLSPSGSSGASGFHAYRGGGKDFGYMTPPHRGSKSYYYNPNGSSSLRGSRPSSDVLKDTFILSASGSTKSKSQYPFTPAILSSGPSEYSSSGLGSSEYSSPSSRPSSLYSSSSRPSSSEFSSSLSSSRPSKYSSPSSRPYSSPSSGISEYSSSGSSEYPSSGPSEYSPSGPSEYSSESSEYASSASPTASSSPYPSTGSSSPPGSSTITVTSDQPLSLQEIVAKAAQEQHQKVLAREQQSHPGSVVSHNIRLAPQYQPVGPPQGSLPPQYQQQQQQQQQQILAQQQQQQQILTQQGGQPGQQRPGPLPQHLYNPQQQYAIQGGAAPPQHVLIRGPPTVPGQQILVQGPNGQPMLVQIPQGQPQLQYIHPQGGPQGQPIQYIQTQGGQQPVRIAQQPGAGAPPQYSFAGPAPGLIPYQQIPQQGFPIGLGQPQFAGQQIYTLPGPHGFYPQTAPIGPEGLLGQPQFTLSQQEQQQIQTNQLYNQQQQQAQASEQIATSASEQSEQISAEASSVSVSTVEAPEGISSGGESSLTGGSSDDPVTAALIQSHTEYSEPVHKIE